MRNLTQYLGVDLRMSRFPSLCLALLAFGLGLWPLPVVATTVSPPDFDSMTAESDYIVRTVVQSVTSEWQVKEGRRRIVTLVTLEIREVISGSPPTPLVLQFLGGKVGEDELWVEGSPRFTIGQEDILFVTGNGRQFCPLVGVMHGRYRVLQDEQSHRTYVARSNGRPLFSESEVALPLDHDSATAAVGQPLSPAEFTARIRLSRQKAPAASATKLN